MALIEAKNLVKTYYDTVSEVNVLRGVDLTIQPGEILGVVGASGVGKTTLLYILGTLERPSEGSVLYDGNDIFAMKSDRELALFRNEKVGFVFQFHHLIPEFTACENVMLPCMIAKIPKEKARERAMQALSMLGVDHRSTHKPGELSGGEQQRVAVARALVMRPEVVLADEPTGNLDTDTSEKLHEEFLRLNQEHKITFIIVTHNERLAEELPRIVRLERGHFKRNEQDGPHDDDFSPDGEIKIER